MKCPKCGKRGMCYKTSHAPDGAVIRLRKCPDPECLHRWTTRETESLRVWVTPSQLSKL
jgi:transcriptional regulator NrdR family protein